MNKKKVIACALTGLMALSAFAGCGGTTDANTIKFYSFAETPAELQAYKTMVDKFNKTVGKEEGIRVAYSPKTAGDFESLIIRMASSKNGPDVFMVPEKKFKAWVRYNLLSEMDEYVTGLDLSAIWTDTVSRYHYNPNTNTSTANDPIYSLPIDSSPTGLFYNKDAMEAAGVIVIGVAEEDMDAWNAGTIADKYGKRKSDYAALSSVTVPTKGYFRSGIPYYSPDGSVRTWYSPYNNRGELKETLVFNDEIPMNWDEVEDLAHLLTKSKNQNSATTYGYYTEWWFNYGWSVGGDCLEDMTGDGDWTYTLADYTPNYMVMQSGFTGAYTGKTYAVGETVEFLDKLKINQGDSVEPDNLGGFKVNGTSLSTELTPENAIRDSVLQAEESGVLAQLPSTKTAIRRFANLAGSNTLDVSPQPNDLKNVTSFSQFVVGEIAMIIETAANIPSAQNLAEFEWGVAPLPQYKQYVDPTDGANDEVVVMGKESGHAESVSVSIREKSVKKELAGKFIEFLVGEQGQALKLAQGLVPNQRSVAENAAYNFNYMNVFLRAMDNQKAGDWWYMPDVRWISVWADRLNGDVRNGTMDLEAWFTNYIAPTNEILSEYVVAIED